MSDLINKLLYNIQPAYLLVPILVFMVVKLIGSKWFYKKVKDSNG